MRKTVHQQLEIVPVVGDHEHAQELQGINEQLDEMPEVLDWVYADLTRGGGDPTTGREAMSAEQVLRVLIIKQMNGFSYDQLSFHLADSCAYRSFCRFGFGRKVPQKSTLNRNIKRIRPETLERINRRLVQKAKQLGIEKGRKVRTDCTVEETNIHDPKDSSLLFDGVRVLTRLMGYGRDKVSVQFTDHCRRAKRRSIGIEYAPTDAKRLPLYRDLIKVTEKTVSYAQQTVTKLEQHRSSSAVEMALVMQLVSELRHYIDLTGRVLDQTRRRVFFREKVPATEKVVSLFETHTDIIRKDRRETYYGHKLCLTTGRSGLVLDCVVLDGNPNDASLAVDMVKRQQQLYGRVPRQVAFDGGFASKTNLADIKALEVEDVCFAKGRGLKLNDMVKSSWVYRQLRRFRAGVESGISFLKRCFGLDRCTWRGHESFKAYTWASVLSANLLLLARHTL